MFGEEKETEVSGLFKVLWSPRETNQSQYRPAVADRTSCDDGSVHSCAVLPCGYLSSEILLV